MIDALAAIFYFGRERHDMKPALLFVHCLCGWWKQFPLADRWLKARISPKRDLGLRLTLSAIIIVTGCWIFAVAAGGASVTAFSSLPDYVFEPDFAPDVTATRWEINLLGSSILMGSAILALAALLAQRRSWNRLVFLLVAVGGGLLIRRLLQHFLLGWHHAAQMLSLPLQPNESFPSSSAMAVTLCYGSLAAIGGFTFCSLGLRAIVGLAATLLILRVCFGFVYLGIDSLSAVLGAVAASVTWLTLCFTIVDTFCCHQLMLGQMEAATP